MTERHLVALYVYPKTFCADEIKPIYELSRLGRSISKCLSDGRDPFPGSFQSKRRSLVALYARGGSRACKTDGATHKIAMEPGQRISWSRRQANLKNSDNRQRPSTSHQAVFASAATIVYRLLLKLGHD